MSMKTEIKEELYENKKEKREYQSSKGSVIKESVFIGSEALEKAPEIYGIETGVEGLDDLFFTVEVKGNKVAKKSLGGIPAYSVFNLTGVSDTGKSLMGEQFAVFQANKGKKVTFITVESPANFVIASLRLRATAMGINFEKIQDNLILIDAASNSQLRENIPDLLATLAYVIKNYNVKFTVIDSITGLYENKEMMARAVVRKLFNFMKKWYQTAIFISQKRSGHEELTAEAAGGYAVSHIVDGSMVLAKELVDSPYKAKLYKKEIGEIVRLFRIDGCRMSGHDTRTRFLEITETGLVRIGDPISKT